VRLAQRDSTLNGTLFAHHDHAKIDVLLHHAGETNLETTLTAFSDHDILILHVLHVFHPQGLDLLFWYYLIGDKRAKRMLLLAVLQE
jgi:hypothetical protein